MNSAYFIVFSGTMVHLTCLPEAISATCSTVSFDFTLSIQACDASFTSLPSISVASWKAAIRALNRTGFLSRNCEEVQATVNVCGPPNTS